MNPFNTQSNSTEKQLSKSTFGFTLIEILVAMSVIAIVSSVVFTQRQTFNQSVGLNNVAQEVALIIRQAQNYGVSSRGSSLEEPIDEFAYAVRFIAYSNEFILYRDSATSPLYNEAYQSGQDQEIETYRYPDDVRPIAICVNSVFSDISCTPGPGGAIIIRFSRPHPDAEFRYAGSGGIIPGNTAVLLLEDTNSGARRKIIIRKSGFISVE